MTMIAIRLARASRTSVPRVTARWMSGGSNVHGNDPVVSLPRVDSYDHII